MLSDHAKASIRQHIASLPSSLRRQPATEADLEKFEVEHGAIPDDYRWFLLTCGGGHFGAEAVDDIARLFASHRKFKRESGPNGGWTMSEVFVIGWDGFGNPFGIEKSSGRIVLEDHNFGGIHQIAPSLEEFMLKGIWK